MPFYVVGNKLDSGQDEIYSIEGNDVTEESAEQTFYHADGSVFGEEIAKKLEKNFSASKYKSIIGKEKIRLLKIIDKYYYDEFDFKTHYTEKENSFVIYQIKL